MAKLKLGIFGPISGKLGPLVGGTWNGIPYVRQSPKSKSTPRSEAQLANQHKMVFINQVLLPFHTYISIGFQHLAIGKTAISAAYSANYHRAVSGVYPDLHVDYSQLKLSSGKLPGLLNPVVSLDEDVLTLTWEKANGNKGSYNDQLMLVLYAPEVNIADGFVGTALRRDLHCSFQLNPKMQGLPLEVYVALTSMDRKRISDSRYLGRVTGL